MLRTILVPLDGSAFSQHALPVARAIAQRAGATVVLTQVQPGPAVHPTPAHRQDARRTLDDATPADQRRHALTWLAARGYEVQASHVAARWKLLDGPVVATLSTQAQAADLVVLTSHGRGTVARTWRGSVADGVVRHGRMPTVLVRPSPAAEAMPPAVEQVWELRRLLIALDGSALAEQILVPATHLARVMGAEVVLLRIAPPRARARVTGTSDGDGRRRAGDHAQAYLAGVAHTLRGQGLAVQTRVEWAPLVAQAILRVTHEERCDLIALATHGRGGPARLVRGSVADTIIRGATTPVLLLRPAPRGDRARGA